MIRDGSVIADLPTSELLSKFAEDRFEVRVAGLLTAASAGKMPAGAWDLAQAPACAGSR